MKRNRKLMLMGCALGMLSFTACTDGYEVEPVENFTLDYVFSTTDSVGTQAVQYLNNIYRHLSNRHNFVGGDYLDAATDDAISIYYDDSEVYKLAMGRYTANNRVGADMDWGSYYTTIREATVFIANIDRVPFKLTFVRPDETRVDGNGELLGTPLNVTMKAEARFLRALAYFELVKRYGGVPLLGERVFELEDDMEVPRNTFAECIEYIVSELDKAKVDLRGLPMTGSDPTNYAAAVNREACAALKSRVLLYAASKLFNEAPVQAGNELVGYASYDRNRWQLAADAAWEFMTTYGHLGAGNIRLNNDFRSTFLNYYSGENTELIWFVQGEIGGTNLERINGPLGFTGNALGQGRTLPTQNLVEAFPMRDGKPIGESDKYTYDVRSQYDNRDPRLDMTVLHNGSSWLGRQLVTYQNGSNNPTSSALYTRTSYYMAKFMKNYADGSTREYQQSTHPWVMLRYAEILLNYAEAKNEILGAPDQSVYDCIVELRRRAGIEAGANNLYGLKAGMNQDEMRQIIYNERRIEMAFEEQRYYDIRRWKIAGDVFAQPVRGLTITNRDGQLNFADNDLLNVQWNNRRYLYPIPYSEVLKNSNMVQNPNW